MKKLKLIIILFFLLTNIFAQEIEYTNKFFVTNIGGGYCYVFMYNSNKVIFVHYITGRRQPTIIEFNGQVNYIDAFAAGDYLICKLDSYNFFSLPRILENKLGVGYLADHAYYENGKYSYNNLDKIHLYMNDMYYSKINDSNIYFKNSNTPEKILFTANTTSRKQVLYLPIIGRRENEYKEQEKKINDYFTIFNNLEKEINIAGIENRIIAMNRQKNAQRRGNINKEEIYKIYEDELKTKYVHNKDDFAKLQMLAQIIDAYRKINTNTNNTQTLINRFHINRPSEINDQNIRNYISEYDNLSISEEEQIQIEINKTGINNRISTQNSLINNKFGDIDFIRRELNKYIRNRALIWSWTQVENINNIKSKYENSYRKIIELGVSIKDILSSGNYLNVQNLNRDYEIYNKQYINYDWMVKHYNNDRTDDNVILNMLITLGKELNNYQNDFLKNYYEDIENEKLRLNQLELEKEQIANTVRQNRSASEVKKRDFLNIITRYSIDMYRNSIFKDIYKPNPLNINVDYLDYCIISNQEKWINGFNVTNSLNISLDDRFYDNTSISNRTVISTVKDGIFIIISPGNIKAYDITNPDITMPNIPELRIEDNIRYLVQNNISSPGKYQYVVTQKNQLIRLSIENGRIVRDGRFSESVNENDIVLVTDDDYYILPQDGRVRGNITGNTIKIRTSNSAPGQIPYELTYRNNKFIF
jgi:hypothetical protein